MRYYLGNIILCLVILIILFVLLSSVIFRVKTVEIKGNKIYSNAVVEDIILNDKYRNNGLYDVVKNTFFPQKDIPFVRSSFISASEIFLPAISPMVK